MNVIGKPFGAGAPFDFQAQPPIAIEREPQIKSDQDGKEHKYGDRTEDIGVVESKQQCPMKGHQERDERLRKCLAAMQKKALPFDLRRVRIDEQLKNVGLEIVGVNHIGDRRGRSRMARHCQSFRLAVSRHRRASGAEYRVRRSVSGLRGRIDAHD